MLTAERLPDNCPALVLNADYRPLSYFPLSLWSWQDTIKAVFLDRVNIVAEYDRTIRSVSHEMRLPSVVSLKSYVKPTRKFRAPTDQERGAIADLRGVLAKLPAGADSEAIQFEIYEVGKRHGYAADLRAWFKVLYEVLFGTEQGPRMGSFVALYGVPETIALVRRVAAGEAPG